MSVPQLSEKQSHLNGLAQVIERSKQVQGKKDKCETTIRLFDEKKSEQIEIRAIAGKLREAIIELANLK